MKQFVETLSSSSFGTSGGFFFFLFVSPIMSMSLLLLSLFLLLWIGRPSSGELFPISLFLFFFFTFFGQVKFLLSLSRPS